MVLFGGVSLGVGAYFWTLGACVTGFGFFGLDVALLYFGFRLNYRYGRRYDALQCATKSWFAQGTPLGIEREWVFDPFWMRIKLERHGQDEEEIGALILSSHGKYVSVDAFLSPQERESLSASLQLAMAHWRDGQLEAEQQAEAAQ